MMKFRSIFSLSSTLLLFSLTSGGSVPRYVDNDTVDDDTSYVDTNVDSNSTITDGDNYQNAVSSGVLISEPTDPYQGLWMAHGILLAIAWGICLPIGIGASLLRNALGKLSWAPKDLWYSIHFYMNTFAVVLTIVGVSCAIAATQKNSDVHFGDKHPKTGLSILVLVIIQASAAYFKPGKPADSPPPPTKQQEQADEETENVEVEPKEQGEEPVKAEGSLGIGAGTTSNEVSSSSENPSSTESATKKAPTKSMQRIAWEYSHRLLGVALLGLAWSNVHTGIQLQVESWPESKDWTGIFWGITAGLSGTIIVLAIFMRMRK
jgi:hypothetical protein